MAKNIQKNKHKVFISYPVGDFLIRIKNAARGGRNETRVPFTKLVDKVAQLLKDEGYIDSLEVKDGEITARLAMRRKETVLMDVRLISKPGLRHYVSVDELASFRGPEMYILSTPKGILSSKSALKKNVGGELIAKIW